MEYFTGIAFSLEKDSNLLSGLGVRVLMEIRVENLKPHDVRNCEKRKNPFEMRIERKESHDGRHTRIEK